VHDAGTRDADMPLRAEAQEKKEMGSKRKQIEAKSEELDDDVPLISKRNKVKDKDASKHSRDPGALKSKGREGGSVRGGGGLAMLKVDDGKTQGGGNLAMAHAGDAPRAAHAQEATSRVSPGEQAAALRLKALHALALEDLTKAELKGKLKGKVPKQMLKELARRVETPGDADKEACKYKLKPVLWLEVEMDTWSEYSEDDRSVLAIRFARAKEEGAGTSSTARSPSDAHASRSPVNQDAAADDKKAPKGDDAGSLGGALRGAGRQGSAFEDVKGGVRSDCAAAPPAKSPPSHEPSDEKCMKIAHKASLDGTASNKSSSPTDGKQVEASCKTREAAIPRKRARDSSEACSEPSSKEARKSEASSSILPSSILPSHAPPSGDKDRGKDKDKDRGRESERQGDGRKARTDSSDSPGLMLKLLSMSTSVPNTGVLSLQWMRVKAKGECRECKSKRYACNASTNDRGFRRRVECATRGYPRRVRLRVH
jgi:hypothetical protein